MRMLYKSWQMDFSLVMGDILLKQAMTKYSCIDLFISQHHVHCLFKFSLGNSFRFHCHRMSLEGKWIQSTPFDNMEAVLDAVGEHFVGLIIGFQSDFLCLD